jgi:hypothetical protein
MKQRRRTGSNKIGDAMVGDLRECENPPAVVFDAYDDRPTSGFGFIH